MPEEDKKLYRKELSLINFSGEKAKFGKPKHVRTGYMLFISDHIGIADRYKKWQQLTDNERLSYADRSKKDQLRYK